MFEEQIQEYKGKRLPIRLAIASIPGLVLAGYLMMTELETAQNEVNEAEARKTTATSNLGKAKQKDKAFPELERKMEAIKTELGEAKKQLPDEVLIDDVLRQTAQFAAEIGVDVQFFKPNLVDEQINGEKYAQRPIEVVVRGKFNKVASLYDRLLHINNLVHLRKVGFKSITLETTKKEAENKSREQRIALAETLAAVESRAQLVIYRGVQ